MPNHPNYDLLPEHCRLGMKHYLELGIEPGSFLTAVICNQLVEAFARADGENQLRMMDYACFLYNEAPRGSWGSPRIMDTWMERQREWVAAQKTAAEAE